MKLNNLFTRDAANAGAVLTVLGPDAKPCGLKITVRGTDCDEFRLGTREMQRVVLEHLDGKAEDYRKSKEYIAFTDEQRLKLVSTLVAGWEGVDEPCTPENVLLLFKNAPYVVTQVDEFGSKRERFAGNSSPTCAPSQPDKSS